MSSVVHSIFAVLLVTLIGAETVAATIVAGWGTAPLQNADELVHQLALLPQLDATGWADKPPPPPRCNTTPEFPVGQHTLVKVRTPTGDRQFVLYIPHSYLNRNRSRVALQVLFHGLNDNCDNFLNATGFIPYAEREGYILASACGSVGLLGIGWNSGTCCGFTLPNKPDDFAFAQQLVDTVSTGACVDPAKVMAIGFSNGAMMVEVLACHKPTVFRAVASVSGIVELRPGNDAGLEACGRAILVNNTEGLRTSVLMVHGNHDILVPVGGNSFLGFPPLQDNVAGWANFNGCNEATDVTINASRYRNLIYSDCDSGADVWETRVKRYVRRIKDVVVGHLTGRHAADLRHSVVEIVHALQGGHEWPEDDEFSTTDYVHAFGARVFSGY